MSRRDRSRFVNRDNRETQQTGVGQKTTPSDPAKIESTVAEDAEKGPSIFNKIGTFFGGCFGQVSSFSQSAVSKPWGWCKSSAQWLWGGLRFIASYCTIRWNTEETEDEIDETESPKGITNIESAKIESPKSGFMNASTKPAETKPILAKPVYVKGENKAITSSATDPYESDELTSSRWWGIGIKSAAIAAALLIIAAGYFVIKPLFDASTDEIASDIEILEPTEQSPLLVQSETSPVAIPPASVTPSVAVPAPVVGQPIAAAIPPPPPPPPPQSQPQQSDVFAVAVPSPSQGTLLDDSTFAAPVAAEAAPPVADDPFGAATPNPVVEPLTPAVVESVETPAQTTLPPLAALKPVEIASSQPPSQLSPLVPLGNVSAPVAPAMTVAAAPVAAPAAVHAPVAANRGEQRNPNRRSSSPAFSDAPTPPAVTMLPQNAVERTIAVTEPAEPTRELIPQIQHTGTIQNVPPPIVAAEPVPEYPQNAMNTETVPAIPRDAPQGTSPPTVVVPAAVPVAEFSADTQPIDRQLWEQVHELQGRAEAEPMQLRLNETTPTIEPALRFTPRDTAPGNTSSPAIEDNLLAREAANSFGDLMPVPNSNEIAVILPALENAPQPVFAELAPAYRNDATSQAPSVGGLTFQSRIASEVSRSPSATETYTIQQGDTYMTISERFYGTSLLSTALSAHNQQLGIGWRPAEGVVIEIPTAEFLRTRYGEATNRQEYRLESQRAAVRYIVQEGDTVFRLATDK